LRHFGPFCPCYVNGVLHPETPRFDSVFLSLLRSIA
jgi:hypothetical protein